ncbi:MAG: restriction endonuclease [Balneolales bacterium]
MTRSQIHIIKASGLKTTFSEQKLRNSLEQSGATETQIESVIREVSGMLHDGISTKKIYRKAYEILRKSSYSQAARYKLKNAIMELGPSGYPFEKYIGAILEEQGFETNVSVETPGRCVTHEIDVVARKNRKVVLVECKFHNRPGVKCDVKIPLYIHSRFRDVVKVEAQNDHNQYDEYEGWIVTNTRFTEDALQYGNCSGMVMIGWDYPRKTSLKHRIGLSGLHPLTCLGSLNRREKDFLLQKGVVLCRHIMKRRDLLGELGLSVSRIDKVLGECNELVHMLGVPAD